jgi:transposase
MAKGIRYSEEFKQEAANQVIHHNYPVAEVAERLGISSKTLYNWIKTFSQPPKKRHEQDDMQAEIARLKKQLKRAEQERDILKEAARFFANESKNDTPS